MARSATRWAVAAVLGLGLLGLSGAAAQDVTVKGKIRVGHHRQKLEEKKLYHVKVEADGFRPVVNIQPGFFIHLNSREADTFQACFVPRETREYTLRIAPDLFDDLGEGPLKYTVVIKNIALSAKPLLAENSSLTKQDPIYKNADAGFARKCHFKAYPLKLKGGQFYVIDMEDLKDRMDPYLYVEDPGGKIVASDDDSAGNLNARLIFQPRRDGEYRIIATTLSPATGGFKLTVRGQETK